MKKTNAAPLLDDDRKALIQIEKDLADWLAVYEQNAAPIIGANGNAAFDNWLEAKRREFLSAAREAYVAATPPPDFKRAAEAYARRYNGSARFSTEVERDTFLAATAQEAERLEALRQPPRPAPVLATKHASDVSRFGNPAAARRVIL